MLLQFFSSASQVQHKFTSYVTALSYGRSSLLQALELPNPFNRLFSMTIWVSCDIKYQSINQAGTSKSKNSLDFNGTKDDWILGCNNISWTICKQSAPRCRQITTLTPHHSMFTGRVLFLMPNQQRQSTVGTRFRNDWR